MDIDAAALTAALEGQYGGEAEVHPDEDGGMTGRVSGAHGTMCFSTGPGHSAFLRYGLGIQLPSEPDA